ncbi:hypothetical protein [Tumebacillus permanentifrigoris]|uniref:Uncharacterized protein n=1 Tax=Tumebacillus permanentifrigoris TaxID=378543 RepID=A0A316DET5_9BACL|nr:hypothetical protein [Tumebacillus permanentifrigoris]PWK15689.1 hypothetical protein C7459_103229 [Tumebacillus permanentifrigoris]
MSTYILKAMFVIALVLLLEWRVLRRESRSTRWLYFSMLGVSTCIWLYLGIEDKPVRPSVWLEQVLSPLSINNLR